MSSQQPAEPDLEERIRALLDQRQKIAAVKLYREQTGSSLLEAKNAVEAIEAGSTLPRAEMPAEGDWQRDVLRLLVDRKKIAAIKLYRQQMGVGLKEAKEAVEELGRRNGIESRGGCLGVLAFFIFAVLAAVALAGSWTAAEELPEMSPAKKNDNGILIHEVQSELQAGKTLVRVLLPDELEKGRRYRVIYVLPVEAGVENRYGDGLLEVKKHDLHNKHGVIFVAPTFSHLPWYADHPTDKTIRQEDYFLNVVLPLIEKTYPAQAEREGRLLLGFSKSGWGRWALLLRHDDTFARAAAWDAPLMMDRLGKYGTSPIFGDQETFETYRITDLLRRQAKSLGKDNRLILTGHGNFRDDHQNAHALLEELSIPHTYRDGPPRKHTWHSGWVEEAVELLLNNPRP